MSKGVAKLVNKDKKIVKIMKQKHLNQSIK